MSIPQAVRPCIPLTGWLCLIVMGLGLTCLILLPRSAVAQSSADAPPPESTRSITIPAPETGIIYIRSGTPGGVRIRSRRTPAASQRTAASEAVAVERFDAADLTRLERLLARQGLDLELRFGRSRGEDVIILRRRGAAAGLPADTLSVEDAGRLLLSFGGARAPNEAPRADLPPLERRIERSILDTGLFRSLQVNFEFDRSELLPTGARTLNAVADVLARYPELRIEVAGHADSVGPEDYNERLSQRRAEEVRRYLVLAGVEGERVVAEGYGEAQPILSNETPTGRALNRRVEFVLLNPEAAEQYRSDVRQRTDTERLRESIRQGIREGFDMDDTEKD